jgi:hypothetical protein
MLLKERAGAISTLSAPKARCFKIFSLISIPLLIYLLINGIGIESFFYLFEEQFVSLNVHVFHLKKHIETFFKGLLK